MISCEKDFGLKVGDELIQCDKGFTWNQPYATGKHTPKKVTVIKEYPRFILVEAYFGDFYNPNTMRKEPHSYKESINKAAYFAGDCYFMKLPSYD